MLEAEANGDTSSEKATDEESIGEENVLIPDGGWGWVVCFAVFWLNFCVAGIGTSNGILLLGLTDLYNESISKAAMVGSIFLGALMSAGPLVLILMSFRASHRQVIISGGFVAFASTLVSVFSPMLELLYFTYGILTGGSLGMSYFAGNTILASYFKKKRSLAVGIAFCGGGCGVFALSYLMEKSISFYGMKSTFLLLSGIYLNMVVFGALCRPLKCLKMNNRVKEKKKQSVKGLQTETNSGFEPEETSENRSRVDINVSDMDTHRNSVSEDMELSHEKQPSVFIRRVTAKCKNIFDPVVYKNHGVRLLLIIYFIWSAGEVVPVFLPANVVHRGLTREEGALLMSIYGVMFAASQLVVGMIADLLHVPISYILAVSMVALTLTSVAIPFCYTFLAFAFCTGVFAIFHGFTTALRVMIAAAILGVKNLNKCYSPICLLIGVGYIIFPLMTGALYDATQSFDYIFYFIGGTLFFGLIASTGIIYLQVKGKFKE